MLLVPSDNIPTSISIELSRLHPNQIVIFGGTSAVSDAVAEQRARYTTSPGTRVGRFWGADRCDTSAAIAAVFKTDYAGTAYIANGSSFPDALSGAPLAGSRNPFGAPVLLVTADSIPDSIKGQLRRIRPERIVVLGGPNAVSDAVLGQLSEFAETLIVSRISGVDRFSTSAAISAQSGTLLPAQVVYVAIGRNLPDALSCAPVAGMSDGPVLLVEVDEIPDAIKVELTRLRPAKIVVLGGVNAVSSSVQTPLSAFVR